MGIGNWNLGLGLWIDIWDLRLGIRIGDWGLELRVDDCGLVFGIGEWHWILGFGLGFGIGV